MGAWHTLHEALPQMSLQPSQSEEDGLPHPSSCVCRGEGRVWVKDRASGLEQVPCPVDTHGGRHPF